ncbi:hypothetical protein DTB58_37895 [Streptomyces griseus]|nr:hypothetical protein [Streptomyces griseus]NEB57010.1 transposase [Streptomyces griseus]
MGEAPNGTFKPELIEMRSPWKDVDQVERATLQRITRYNEDRLHSALDHVPPDEYEEAFRRSQEQPPQSPEATSPDSARPGLAHVGPETRSSERYWGSPPDRVVSVLWERAASKTVGDSDRTRGLTTAPRMSVKADQGQSCSADCRIHSGTSSPATARNSSLTPEGAAANAARRNPVAMSSRALSGIGNRDKSALASTSGATAPRKSPASTLAYPLTTRLCARS